MAAVTSLDTALERIRFALGDTGATSFFPGGEALITAMLTLAGNDEAATYVAAAGVLANYYAGQPASVSSSGESVAWPERAAQWRLVAKGLIPYPFGPDGDTLTASNLAGGSIALGFQETNP